MTSDRVFVYGTLKVGEANHPLIALFVREVISGSVAGDLLDLGSYPGWVEGAGTVHGEILRVSPVPVALRVLDELEEYFGPGDPRNLYDRAIASVSTAKGPLAAWTYRYIGPTVGAPVIRDGVWKPTRLV